MKTKRRGFDLRRKEMVTGLLFVSPWIVGIIFFYFSNILRTVVYSFNRLSLLDEGGYTLTWLGLDNFRHALFVHVTYNRVLFESIVSILWGLPMIIFFSLFMALLLNRKFPGRALTRAIFFLPVIMATEAVTGAIASASTMMFAGISPVPPDVAFDAGFDANTITFMLLDFGVPMQAVSYIVNAIAQLHNIIRSSSVQIIIFLAALQAIPPSLYEVAQIEGATGYESFWKITFPMVSPLILTNIVYTIVDSYTNSNIAQLAHQTAFPGFNFGVSAAMGIMSTVMTCVLLLIVGFVVSRYVHYNS